MTAGDPNRSSLFSPTSYLIAKGSRGVPIRLLGCCGIVFELMAETDRASLSGWYVEIMSSSRIHVEPCLWAAATQVLEALAA